VRTRRGIWRYSSVAVAAALQALASNDSARAGPALERLNRPVENTPLEPLSPGVRANARQRAEAARQVPPWLVARACRQHATTDDLRAMADRLSSRALEAARRQNDNQALLAMLREQGELALSHGDRKAAEAAWSRMLETVLPAVPTRSRVQRPSRTVP
jgi:hypothetical protein